MAGEKSYTPLEFCEAERISRSFLYTLWREGSGPRYYTLGNRRRISEDARLEWRREREAESAGPESVVMRQRREASRKAGLASAATSQNGEAI